VASGRNKRDEWLTWLKTDEYHAIWQQITAMVWDDVVFRVLSSAQNSFPEGAATNWLLGLSLERGYVATQVLGIRRLQDKASNVISLRRLRDDVYCNRNLLTRELFVSHDGSSYDGRNPESERLHRIFDDLSGVAASNRCRMDCVSAHVLEKLNQWWDDREIGEIVTWGNKFLMHAADPRSRSGVSAELNDFSSRIAQTHRGFVRVAEAISIIIGDSRHTGVVPVSQYTPFAGLDHPYAKPATLCKFDRLLEQLSKERDGWVDDVFGDLTNDHL
jgi:hypothetical protein